MKQGWELKDFEGCIERIPRTTKIPKKQFLAEGKYPIISQENDYINGYWDKSEDLLKVDRPLVIFGDHTKKLKYIDFDFVLGADGVKVLLPIKTIDARFFYYQLQSIALGDLGYARHYRLLKQERIVIPSLEEQKQIVAKLDLCFEAIDKARANATKNLENAKELFQSKLNDIFSQKGEGWVEKKLGEISDVTYGFTDKSVEVGDFRYVRITDIDNNGELISTGKKYISSSKDGKKFILRDNDILMARTGATFAKLLLYKDIEPSIFASYLIKIDFTESINNEFYWFYAKSNSYWDQANTLSTGSAQPHFNGKALKQVLFPYPVSKTEQSRLINEFKRFQSKTQSLESKYQQELNSLEELKKSILQKAFEGEL